MEIYRLVYVLGILHAKCGSSVVQALFSLYSVFSESLQRALFVFKEEYANFVKMYATFNIRVNKYKH